MIRTIASSIGRLVVDTRASTGCTLVDVNARRYIDLNANIASLVLGYNHPALTYAPAHLIAQRSALNLWPSIEYEEQLKYLWPRISPYGSNAAFLHLCSSGSEAIETALKLCMRRSQGTIALSFSGGFHGRTCGALSLMRSNTAHRDGFPTIANDVVDFPSCKDDEARCLVALETRLVRGDVCALFVEPIQGEGGNQTASSAFFRAVREIARRKNVAFVVDEIQTAMGTGRLWAHHEWHCAHPPDIVTFSKKTQVAGLFAMEKYAPNSAEAYAYNSTWAGDTLRAYALEQILDTIERDRLYERSMAVGTMLFNELRCIPGITNVRNVGSFGAFDVDNRTEFIEALQQNGVLLAPCGTGNSVRVRPPLVLSPQEAECATEAVRQTLN